MIVRKPFVLAAAILLLCVMAGCASTPSQKPAAPTSPAATKSADGSDIIEPGRIGPFAVGMTAKQLKAAGLVEEPPPNDCPTLRPVAKFTDIGLQFNNSEVTKPLTGVLLKGPDFRTSEGIQVGDSTSRLKNAYGSRLDKRTGEYDETVYVLEDRKMAMGFAVEGDKISAIEVFAAGVSLPVWDGC